MDEFVPQPKSQAQERDEHYWGESDAERIEREEERYWRFAERLPVPRLSRAEIRRYQREQGW
jgi:hypothetical protein